MAIAKIRVPIDTFLLLSCLHKGASWIRSFCFLANSRVPVGHAPFALMPKPNCCLNILLIFFSELLQSNFSGVSRFLFYQFEANFARPGGFLETPKANLPVINVSHALP